ncbi:MAG: T9SS type A sorting domain-containing protein, partial [Bacteroidota bacterium]
ESYSGEINTGFIGGSPENENYSYYLGFTALNVESAVVTVRTQSGQSVINDPTEGVILEITSSGNYDTLTIANSNDGNISFDPVFAGDYLVSIDSDTSKYVATYYGNSFLWEEAGVLELSGDSTVDVTITPKPSERSSADGDGVVSGTIEEEFEDDQGRIEARRRAARRKCGLRKRRRGGRTDQDDGFDLIAYGETNDQGEFEYGFLPQGTYRFFVEYPGIPIDPDAFVEFEVGAAGVGDNTFVLAAFVTEEGISIELVLGIADELFTNLTVYPNPTADIINVKFDELLNQHSGYEVIDIKGSKLIEDKINPNQKFIQLDVKSFDPGIYLLKFYSEKQQEVLTYKIIKRQ